MYTFLAEKLNAVATMYKMSRLPDYTIMSIMSIMSIISFYGTNDASARIMRLQPDVLIKCGKFTIAVDIDINTHEADTSVADNWRREKILDALNANAGEEHHTGDVILIKFNICDRYYGDKKIISPWYHPSDKQNQTGQLYTLFDIICHTMQYADCAYTSDPSKKVIKLFYDCR